MSAELLKRIEAQFRADERRRIEVPEWGEEGKPLELYYLPVTIDDMSFVTVAGQGDRHVMGAHLVALKATNEKGERLFSQADVAGTLRTKADPIVINRLAAMMMGSLGVLGKDAVETAAKN